MIRVTKKNQTYERKKNMAFFLISNKKKLFLRDCERNLYKQIFYCSLIELFSFTLLKDFFLALKLSWDFLFLTESWELAGSPSCTWSLILRYSKYEWTCIVPHHTPGNKSGGTVHWSKQVLCPFVYLVNNLAVQCI